MTRERGVDGLEALAGASEQEKEKRGTRYTPGEILQQPGSWRRTRNICAERQPELTQFLRAAGIGAGRAEEPVVFLIGAGTSDYIGQALMPLLRRLWGCEVWAVASTTLLTSLEDFVFPNRPYLWISFSRSGESSEGLALLQAAIERYAKVRHLLVTCNRAGKMAEVCERAPQSALVLALDEMANDRGLAMTSSFTNMVVAGQCLAHAFEAAEYDEPFAWLEMAGEKFLQSAEEAARAIAGEDFSRACFVGSGALRAVARESRLKLLELTAGKIFTMSESTLGLRHGPMSALDEETLFVSFVSFDRRRRKYELDLIAEVHRKQLGKRRVVVAPDSIDRLTMQADHILSLESPGGISPKRNSPSVTSPSVTSPSVTSPKPGLSSLNWLEFGDQYRAPVDVMLAQILGLFCSLRLGLKPDSPSPDGAISRVVSHVNIY